jgi:hypothetical protein
MAPQAASKAASNRSALSAASAVGRTSTTEKWLALQEDQALVAVEVGQVGNRAHHRPGLCSRSQPVGAVDVREPAVTVELRAAVLRARPAKAPGSA